MTNAIGSFSADDKYQRIQDLLPQKLVFVMGKGGVGKSTVAASLAQDCAAVGQKVLIVQWAVSDAMGPLFGEVFCDHEALEISPRIFNMNFNPTLAIKEYFVDYLQKKKFYQFVIQHRQIQKLLKATPGIYELFFLGRLYWLVHLAVNDAGNPLYDKIIVDAPATGHGVSLLSVADVVMELGMTGPLQRECERVRSLLRDPQHSAYALVTIPEELPCQEVQELADKMAQVIQRSPDVFFINQTVNLLSACVPAHYKPRTSANQSPDVKMTAIDFLYEIFSHRKEMELRLREWSRERNIPCISLNDRNFLESPQNFQFPMFSVFSSQEDILPGGL